MKYYAVVPSKYWEFCNNNKIRMLVEAKDLMKHKDDVKLYDFGHDWILDNSTALGEETSLDDYLSLVERYRPPIVVVPDILNDGDRTLERTADFIDKLEKRVPGYMSRLMMVPQGKNLEDFQVCMEGLVKTFDPDIVGIPYRYQDPYFIKERKKPVEWALDRSLLIQNVVKPNLSIGTEIHLLGCWHPYEVLTGHLYGCRSIDSSLVYRCAVNRVSLYSGERDLDLSVFEQDVDLEGFKAIYRNFRAFVRLLGGRYESLPNRFEQSDPDKRTIAEGGGVGTAGGETGKD